MRRFPLVSLALALAACSSTPDASPPADLAHDAQALRVVEPGPITPGPVTPGPIRPPPFRAAPTPVQAPRTLFRAKPSPVFEDREVVGMVPGTLACPAGNANWAGGDLFPVFVPSREGQRFCRYTWQGAGAPVISTLPLYCPSNDAACQPCPPRTRCALPATGEQWLEPSHRALFKAGLPADVKGVVAASVRQRHRLAMGAPASMPWGVDPVRRITAVPGLIRVVVLDDNALHGDTVTRWIYESGCPSGACGIYVERRDVFAGADAASPLGLAQQIVEAVRPSGARTVLNLSAGLHWLHAWLDRPNASDDIAGSDHRIVHKALQAALNYATCQGAMTIAAAGNRDGGATAEDPGPEYFGGSTAYPAAFAANGGFGWTCTTSPVDSYKPIIHPVSAIRPSGKLSPSTRTYRQACNVAPGIALTPDDGALEGTSFATAAMTGAVAATWSYMPHDDASHAMWAVRKAMTLLDGNILAAACGVSDGGRIKRVNLCGAVKTALTRSCDVAGRPVCAADQQPNPDICLPANDDRRVYQFTCPLAAQLSCPAIPVLSDTIPVSSTDGQTLFAAASTPTRLLPRAFDASSLAAVPASNNCGLCTVSSDPNDRNGFTCPFGTFDNGQPQPNRLSRSPTVPGCLSCSILVASDRSLWLIGDQLDEKLTSPAVRLSLSNAPLANAVAPRLLVADRVFELGDTLATVSSDFSIKLSDPLAPGVQVTGAELSFMLEDQQNAAFSRPMPVFDATVSQ